MEIMEEKKYLKLGIVLVMLIMIVVTSYAIYINVTSSRHVAMMVEADYASVIGAKASYVEIYPTIKELDIYVKAKWMIDVQTQIDGVVSEIYVKRGDSVKKGQPIAKIENIDLPAQIAQLEGLISQSEAKLLESQQTLSRYESLVKSGSISLQQYDDALANRDVALGELKSNIAQKGLLLEKYSKSIISAPQDSDVISIHRGTGYYIRAGEAIMLLGDFSELVVETDFSNDKLEELLPLAETFTISIKKALLSHKVYPTPFKANPEATYENQADINLKFDGINPPLEVYSPFRTVTWKIIKSGGIIEPTTYQDVNIIFKNPRRVLAIPKNALFYTNTTPHIYIVNQENKLEIRKVKIGVQNDDYVEIKEGIKEGETAIISAKKGLYPNLRVKVSY